VIEINIYDIHIDMSECSINYNTSKVCDLYLDPVKYTVRWHAGDQYTEIELDIQRDDTIKKIKTKIAEITKIPIKYQYLWGLICISQSESGTTKVATRQEVVEKPLGVLYYYNLNINELESMIARYEREGVDQYEINKLKMYYNESRNGRRRHRRTDLVEGYREYGLNKFVNPFNYSESQAYNLEMELFKDGFLRVEDNNDKILQDYAISNRAIINMVDIRDYLDFLKDMERRILTSDKDSDYKLLFINGHIMKYWQFENLFTFVNQYLEESIREDEEIDTVRLSNERKMIDMINTEVTSDIEFDDCHILDLIMNVNYDRYERDFIDLARVSDLYTLNEDVPFIKFKGDKNIDTFSKFSENISSIVSKTELIKWISDRPMRTEIGDLVKYALPSKGLSFRVKTYEKDGVNRYGVMTLQKNGRLEIKMSWEEGVNVDINGALKKFTAVIGKINGLQYQTSGLTRKYTITPPSSDWLTNPYSNTKVIFVNAVAKFTYGDLNFNNLIKMAQCFHDTHANVIRTDITVRQGKTVEVYSNFLKLRYKRISYFKEMDEVVKLVYEIRQQVRDPPITTVANILLENFRGKINAEEAAEIARRNLSKRIKHPGIDVNIKKTSNSSKYNIFILGAKNLLQLSQINHFIKQLLKIFKEEKLSVSKCRLDIQPSEEEEEEIDFYADQDVEEFERVDIEEIPEKEKEKEIVIPQIFEGKYISVLDRLKATDPELFSGNLASTNQANAYTQPIVITGEKYKELLETYGNREELQRGQLIRGNFYFCPKIFCIECNKFIEQDELEAEIIQKKGKEDIVYRHKDTGHYAYFVPDHKTYNPFITFMDPHYHPQGWCMPTCKFRDPQKNPQTRRKYQNCLNIFEGKPEIPEDSDVEEEKNPLYVFKNTKQFIGKGRYAFVPDILLGILQSDLKKANCELVNGYISKGSEFNCYLRVGMSGLNKNDTFLTVIGDLIGKTGKEIRQSLVQKITKEVFGTMVNGNLQAIFDSYSAFIDYLKGDNYINEDFLWDTVTLPGIITAGGFNLFIFEVNFDKHNAVESIILKCPIGYDKSTLFDISRDSVVLYKYSEYYEPIYRVYEDNDELIWEKFFPQREFIKKVLELYTECGEEEDIDLLTNLAKFYEKRKTTAPNYIKPKTARQTYNIIKEIVSKQIADSTGKVTHLLLNNGLKLPVKPSILIMGLEVRPYFIPEEVAVIKNILHDGKGVLYPPLDKVLETLKEIDKRDTSLGVLPKDFFLDETNTLIVGMILKNGLILDVNPIDAKSITGNKLNVLDRAIKNKEIVDYSIAERDNKFYDNKWIVEGNRVKFIEEMYQRLRLELSRYIQNETEIKNTIISIIEDDISAMNKRKKLLPIVKNIVDKITVTTGKKITDEFLSKYVKPNIRVVCFEEKKNCKDSHCVKVKDECKLYLQKDKKDSFISLIIDELARNPSKMREIIDDKVDVYIKRDLRLINNNEMLLTTIDELEKRQQIENLYKKFDYMDKFRKHPEVPIIREKQGKKSVMIATHWLEILGEGFTRKSGNVYDNISEAVKAKQFKDEMWEYIKSLDSESVYPYRKGWLLLAHSLGRDYSSIEDFEEAYKSNNQLTIQELSLISRLYDVKFIILRHRPAIFIPLNTTQSLSDKFIILYNIGDKYDVMIEGDKLIFNSDDIKDLYSLWLEVAPLDNKEVLDDKIQGLIGAENLAIDIKGKEKEKKVMIRVKKK
jgi:hypothetical protein